MGATKESLVKIAVKWKALPEWNDEKCILSLTWLLILFRLIGFHGWFCCFKGKSEHANEWTTMKRVKHTGNHKSQQRDDNDDDGDDEEQMEDGWKVFSLNNSSCSSPLSLFFYCCCSDYFTFLYYCLPSMRSCENKCIRGMSECECTGGCEVNE